MKRKILLLSLAFLILSIGGYWWVGQMLTAPNYAAIDDPPAHLPVQTVHLKSESGSTLAGWFLPGQRGNGAIVLMHPLHGNRLTMLDRAEFLWKAGYSVLLFDFQAHGASPGKSITFGYLESRDARAAVEFLSQLAPGERIGAIGCSLGGAAIILGEEPLRVDAVVLEAVYPTIAEAVANRIRMRLGPLTDMLAPALLAQLDWRLGITPDDLRPIEKIQSLHSPIFVIAGTEDKHTSLAESQRLFDAAGEPKEFWVIDGAAHVDFYAFARKAYTQRILRFFEKYLRSNTN